ncbi:MAG TPA: 2-C-methyl-D-erythritol 4-phosphate cytidylyltransferase [Methylophilaceae bacterium]|jgi:2-C-methyl-D-erythritol 4-phosphate cytidylyltransferase
MTAFHVIIPAAGSGSRMATELPKQYLPLLGATLIEATLKVFKACERLASVNVVLSAQDTYWDAHCAQSNPYVRVLRCGGETRAATVLNGLQALAHEVNGHDWILVHDAARPGLTLQLLDRLLDALQDDEVGGLLAIPLADTLKRADNAQRVAHTEPRDHLWQAQTPQMFRYGLLKQALIQSGGAPTDEAQAVEALGLQPKLVAGELRNLKITYPQDLAIAEAILRADAQPEPF